MKVSRQSLIQLASSVTDLPLSPNSSWSHSPLCCGAAIGAGAYSCWEEHCHLRSTALEGSVFTHQKVVTELYTAGNYITLHTISVCLTTLHLVHGRMQVHSHLNNCGLYSGGRLTRPSLARSLQLMQSCSDHVLLSLYRWTVCQHCMSMESKSPRLVHGVSRGFVLPIELNCVKFFPGLQLHHRNKNRDGDCSPQLRESRNVLRPWHFSLNFDALYTSVAMVSLNAMLQSKMFPDHHHRNLLALIIMVRMPQNHRLYLFGRWKSNFGTSDVKQMC